MLIRSFEQIKELFDTNEPESQILDYKKVPYNFEAIRDEKGTVKKTSQESRHEFLKDVCAMLNDKGGCILLGIEEDAHNVPSGQIDKAGINDPNIPQKYCEHLEQIVLTGIDPPAKVSVHEIKNEAQKDSSFIAINVPQQPFPIYAVIKDKSGNEKNEIFVRRGRNIGSMTVEEIKDRVMKKASYIDDSRKKFDDIMDLFSSGANRDIMLTMYAYPGSSNFYSEVTKSEEIINLLRGTSGHQTEDGHKVTLYSLNLNPYPTFEGMRISVPGKGLEVWENGIVMSQVNLTRLGYALKFTHMSENGGVYAGQREVINPYVIRDYVTNFFRFIVDFYEQTQYFGDVYILIGLCPTNGTYVYRHGSNWGEHLTTHDSQARLDQNFKGLTLNHDEVGSYYGPRGTEKDQIVISSRIGLPGFSSADLGRLDLHVKQNILDYLWRAYTFDEFPDLKA